MSSPCPWSRSSQVNANHAALFGRAPLRVSSKSPHSINSRRARTTVSLLFHPNGRRYFAHAVSLPLLWPLYCIARSISNARAVMPA